MDDLSDIIGPIPPPIFYPTKTVDRVYRAGETELLKVHLVNLYHLYYSILLGISRGRQNLKAQFRGAVTIQTKMVDEEACRLGSGYVCVTDFFYFLFDHIIVKESALELLGILRSELLIHCL